MSSLTSATRTSQMMPQSLELWLSHLQGKIGWTIEQLKIESSMYMNLKMKFSCISGRNVKRESTAKSDPASEGDEDDEQTFNL